MELDFVAVSGIVGILLPLVVSFIKNIGRTWPTQVVKAFAFAAAAVAAVVQVGVDMGWSALNINAVIGSFSVIYALAQTTYKGLWEDTKIEVALASTLDGS